MRTIKRQRLMLLSVVVILVGGATALVLAALDDNIAFFVSPTRIAQGEVESGKNLRLGGLVSEGSVRHQEGGLVIFTLTDEAHNVDVHFHGNLPDLFREGQGIVAQGSLDGTGTFIASEVLAKHDETYMPKEVAESLKEAGVWRHNQDTAEP